MPQVEPLHVVGVNDLLKGLNYIDEDMKERISAAIRPAMLGIRNKARGFVPSNGEVLSGWTREAKPQAGYRPFPRFDSARAKGGIDYGEGENRTFKNGFRVSNYVYNVSAGALKVMKVSPEVEEDLLGLTARLILSPVINS